MPDSYRFVLDNDLIGFIKRHGTKVASAQGVMQKRGETGPWVDLVQVDLQLELHEAQRMKDDLFLALQEFFTDYYSSLSNVIAWVNSIEWSAEELTIPEPE
jgi:hypothetical protein